MSAELLSVSHPEIWKQAIRYPAGLLSIVISGEQSPTLLVKLPHQFLLTARMNRGFKIYVVPINLEVASTIGLISAFVEDTENPLMVWTPLAAEPASLDLLDALSCDRLSVRMIDEHDREFLAYEANVDIPLVPRIRMELAKLYPSTHNLNHAITEFALQWFAARTPADDAEAISIDFDWPMYEEDRNFRDERPDLFQFHGSTGFTEVSLVKLEPGQFQEIDIILLLQRIFSPEQIYHSPRRVYDDEEICDVLVLTDDLCLVIQAKDSPNTESILANSFERKRAKAKSQLDGGCKQIAGAIRYFRRIQPLRFKMGKDEISIDLGNRDILSLVVIRERFDHDFVEYSERLMALRHQIDLPCLGIGYGELMQFCTYCEGPDGFSSAYLEVFQEALKTGIFKRMRFGIRNLYNATGEFRF